MAEHLLPRPLRYSLDIFRGGVRLKAILVFAFERHAQCLDELASGLLGPSEAAYFSTLSYARRQKSYLLGRYAAKFALKDLLSEPDLRAIEIVRGAFEQPIVQYHRNGGWGITISHADSLAIALAYPAGHPMGVDVERIDQARQEAIFSYLSPQESGWTEGSADNRQALATALWAAKEALSKVLTTGLMSPVTIYNLSEFSQIDSGMWEGLFENFAQYKVRVWAGSSYALSVVMPKKSMIGDYRCFCAALCSQPG
jgi:4'-phosphopantetheinyl transferase